MRQNVYLHVYDDKMKCNKKQKNEGVIGWSLGRPNENQGPVSEMGKMA